MLKKGRILSEKKCFAFDCKGNLEIISVFVDGFWNEIDHIQFYVGVLNASIFKKCMNYLFENMKHFKILLIVTSFLVETLRSTTENYMCSIERLKTWVYFKM